MFNFFKKKKKAKVESVEIQKTEVTVPQDYKFQLTSYNRGNDIIVFDPTDEDIKKAISTLSDTHENFIILEARTAINGYTFLQATDYDISAGEVYVEAQVAENLNGKEILHNFGKTIAIGKLFDMLSAYMNGTVPDITGWEHIADF